MSEHAIVSSLPSVVELLRDLTWEQLRLMAEHHGIPVVGRRREPLVERLQAALTDPAHLQATVRVLGPGARGLLGLLVLRGGTGRAAEVDDWRQALRKARADLEPALSALRPTADAAVLVGLGLAFRRQDRPKRGTPLLVVPADLLDRLPLLLDASVRVGQAPAPYTFSRVYAEIGQVVAALAAGPRAARTPAVPAGQSREGESLLTAEGLKALVARSGLAQDAVGLWVELLLHAGALRAGRGRWEIDDRRLAELRVPDVLLRSVLEGWLEAGGSPETGAWRHHIWRLLVGLGPGAWSVSALRATHAVLAGAGGTAGSHAEGRLVADLVAGSLRELGLLGLVVLDGDTFVLAHDAAARAAEPREPRVAVTPDTITVADPDVLPRSTFDLLEALGPARLGEGNTLVWEISRSSLVRFLERGGDIGELHESLAPYGQLGGDFVRASRDLAEVASRIELHYPLPVMVAPDAVTLEHLTGATDLRNVTVPLGERALIVEPSEAEVIFERLQKRGFWPRRERD